MTYIHFEVDDELHRAIKLRAVGQGETIREVGERLFRWYVDGTDQALLDFCYMVAEVPNHEDWNRDALLFTLPRQASALYVQAVKDARQQQGGGEEE